MQITDILAQAGGLQSMARELGISEAQVASGAEALLPALLGGFKKQTQAGGGLAGLGGLLGQLGGGELLDNVLSSQPTDLNRGNQVLGQIFGSRDVSRAVAQNAASQSGLDLSVLKQMLPMLAMALTGLMARQQDAGAPGAAAAAPGAGGLGGLLGGLLGGQRAGLGGAAPGAAGAPAGGPLAGLASMLDLNGDGNALDDVLRLAGKALR